MQIDLMALLKPRYFFARDRLFYLDEKLIKKGLGAVPIGEFKKKFPTDRLPQLSADAVCVLLAENFGTCSQKDGPLRFEGGVIPGHVLVGRLERAAISLSREAQNYQQK